MEETLFEIVDQNLIISETLYCLHENYFVDEDVIKYCLGLCIDSENYELCSEMKKLYEQKNGVDSFKKFNI